MSAAFTSLDSLSKGRTATDSTNGGRLGSTWQAESKRHPSAVAPAKAEPLESGCCGLAGNFGFEAGHLDVSVACAESVLLPAVRAADRGVVLLADGFSCRTQIHQLDSGRMHATVLNFSDRTVTDRLASEHLPAGAPVIDMMTDNVIAEVDNDHACTVSLRPYDGMSLLVGVPEPPS